MADSPSKGLEDPLQKGRPLRVALFSDSAFPIRNGVSVSVKLLMDSLRAKGHEVHLWTTGYPGHRESDPHIHRFLGVFTPFAPSYPLSVPPFYPWHGRFEKGKFDIVHSHTPFTVGFVGLRWAESNGVPIVATYHTHYDRYAHYVPLPQAYVRFKIAKHTHYFYNQVSEVITPSTASRSWLLRHSVDRSVQVIPTGVEPPPLLSREAMRQKLGFGDQDVVALYVGRMAPEKNIPLLLSAFALVAPARPWLRLVLVGDGPFLGEAKALAAKLGLDSRVRVEGGRPREEIDPYYAAADIFFFASITETQGLVVLEAMSHGLPTVLAEGGGAGDPVRSGANGFLCKPTAHSLGEALAAAADSPELRHRLGRQAREDSRLATGDAMTESILSVYRRAIAAGPIRTRTS